MAAAYELARSAALGGQAGRGHGAAVIRARGVAAWMQVQDSLPPAPGPAPMPGPGLPPAPAGQVVTVLAAMTLAAMTAATAPAP